MSRNRRSPVPPSCRGDLPGTPAALSVAATRDIVPRVYVYFDKPLYPSALWEPNWELRIDSWLYLLTNALAFSTHVQIDAAPGGAFNPGPDRVRYFATTPDLRDVDLLYVAAFFQPIVRT